MGDFLSKQDSKIELKAVLDKEPRTWGKIAHLMCSVEANGLWSETSSSFTDWVKSLASLLGKTESSFWRYLSAGRYYMRLRQQLLSQDYLCVALKDVHKRVSPENLEIMEKIERVAPDDLKEELIKRVVKGEVPRSELRDYWRAFRPVLDGKNARGKEKPVFNAANQQQQHLFSQAMVVKALLEDKGAFLNDQLAVAGFHIFMDVNPIIGAGHNQRGFIFDLVMTGREQYKQELLLQGFELSNHIDKRFFERVGQLKQYCDVMWFATTEAYMQRFTGAQRKNLGDEVGIITISESGKIHIKKEAKLQDSSGKSGMLAKALLWELLK